MSLDEAGEVAAIVPFWTAAAERGSMFALHRLAWRLERMGAFDQAEHWLRRGFEKGDKDSTVTWAKLLAAKGEHEAAERIWRGLLTTGESVAVWELIDMLQKEGKGAKEVKQCWLEGIKHGADPFPFWQAGSKIDTEAIFSLPVTEWLEELAREGDTRAMRILASQLEPDRFDPYDEEDYFELVESGRLKSARQLLQRATERGDEKALRQLERLEPLPEDLRRQAQDGTPHAMAEWANYLERRGDSETAGEWWRKAAAAHETWAISRLAEWLKSRREDPAEDPTLRELSDAGVPAALHALAEAFEDNGHFGQAEQLLRRSISACDPEDAWTKAENELALAEFLARHGKADEAENIVRRKVQMPMHLQPHDAQARKLLSELLESGGRHEELKRLDRYGLVPGGNTADPWDIEIRDPPEAPGTSLKRPSR